MKKIQVVIPAAGLGTRFQGTEFLNLKPFIIFNNKTMFEWVILGFKSKKYDVKIDIIVNENLKLHYGNEIKYLEKNYDVKFNYINLITEGPTATSLFLYDKLNNNDTLLIANCDQIVDMNFDDYLDEHFMTKIDGSLLAFEEKEKSARWSYMDFDNDKFIKSVKSKIPYTKWAVVGWHCFSKSKDFLRSGIMQIINQDKANGEYYLEATFNYLIKQGKKAKAIIISEEKMHGVGTPDDLKKYLKNKK
ncbi:MAG: sugar phosphate nucleotidyltransferase [Metamycoplasmataceae bacterium]